LGPKGITMGSAVVFHNEELNIFYLLSNIVRVNKSMRFRGEGHVARWKKVGVLSKC
jgi:hypothetical protein